MGPYIFQFPRGSGHIVDHWGVEYMFSNLYLSIVVEIEVRLLHQLHNGVVAFQVARSSIQLVVFLRAENLNASCL